MPTVLLAALRAGLSSLLLFAPLLSQGVREPVPEAPEPEPQAQAPRPVTVTELRALHDADPQQFLRWLYRQQAPDKGHPDQSPGSHAAGEPKFALPEGGFNDRFWQRLAMVLEGRPLSGARTGGGGSAVTSSSGFVTDPAKFRGTQFLPPYAGEFLQVWAPEPATRRTDALRDLQLYCSDLAHAGVNIVRVFYGFQSWLYERSPGSGIRLADVLSALSDNGITAMVTLGNSYGAETLVPTGPDRNRGSRRYHQPRDLRKKGKKLIIANEKTWTITSGFYQQPGADYLKVLTDAEFGVLATGDWRSYAAFVFQHASYPAFKFVEYWNEPDGGSGKDVFERIGRLIHEVALLRSATAPTVQGVIEVGSPLSFTAFASSWLDPLIGGDWVAAHVAVLGAHPTTVLNHQGEFVATTTSGYPFAPAYFSQGLRSRGAMVGAVEQLLGLLNSYTPARGGFFNELGIRSIVPQYHHDVELALRNNGPTGTWPETLGRMAWTVVTSPHNVFTMLLADGTPWHPKQLEAMRGRYTVKAVGHTESQLDAGAAGIASSGVRIHNPTGARLSNLVEPLVLEGGDTVLLVFADGLDDVPTHSQFGTYPASARPERHRIWVQAFRRSGTGYTSVGLQDLATVTGSPLAALGPDLQFRDIDDNRPVCGILPIRGSLLGAFASMGEWLKGYPNGDTLGGIDATWGGLGGCGGGTSRIATLFNPCGFGEYSGQPGTTPTVPLVERGFMIGGQIAGRMRMQYAGLSSDVRGAFRQSAAGSDHFVLAFARTVRKGLQPGEHYGPGQDARTAADPLGWSANYGDFFRNDPSGEPLKREVVVVDLSVDAVAAVTGSAAVLRSLGAYVLTGAEAIDPHVACNRDGDTAIIARTASDPFFRFAPGVPDPALPWLNAPGTAAQVNGPAWPSPCTLPYLPVPYTAFGTTTLLRERFDVFHRDSDWRVFPWEPAVWLRARGQTAFLSGQFRVGEPIYPASHPLTEDYPRMQDDLHAIQQRDATLRYGADNNTELFFNAGWHSGDARSSPTMDIWDPHTWHPCTNPRVALSDRAADGRTVTVLATWNQFPRTLRHNFVRPDLRTRAAAPAYEARGVRFTADMGFVVPLPFPPAGHLDYGSTAVLGVAAGNHRISKSVRGPVAAFLTPSGAGYTSRAFFQMGEQVYTAGEGGSAVNADPGVTPAVPRRRPPVAQCHRTPVALPAPRPASAVEVAAWLTPWTSGQDQYLRISWNLPQVPMAGEGYLNLVGSGSVRTTDPHAVVVGVVPFTGAFDGSGWPMARVVWKAQDDVFWADFAVGPTSGFGGVRTAAVRRASTATGAADGPFRCEQTAVSVSQNLIAFTHDGAVIAIRP